MHDSGKARSAIETVDRLVPAQFGILHDCLADASGTVYVGQWHGVLEGPLDRDALGGAWRMVVARHSILRTAFDWQLKAEPLQIVLRTVAAEIADIDLADTADDPAQQAHIAAYLARDRTRGFDLNRPPLMRLALLRCAADRHVLVWTRHHLTCDGWSLATLFGELFAIYAALRAGRVPDLRPAVPFADYVAFWNRRDPAADERFWTARLGGLDDDAFLPVATRAAAPDFHTQVHRIDAARLAALRAACRGHRVTLNTLVQGAWGLVLARRGGRGDVLFGATEAVRPDEDDAVCLGPQINTLPVRIDAVSARAVGDWLRAIQSAAVAARHHGRIALPEIAACCGAARGQALFDSVLVFQNYPLDAAAIPAEVGLRLGDIADVSIPDLPVTLIVEPGEDLVCRLIHDRARLGEHWTGDVLRDLDGALSGLAGAAAAAPVRTIDIRPDLHAGLRTDPQEAPDMPTVLHRIAAVADGATALVCGDADMTYGEMRRRARALARTLVREVGAGCRIGLLARPTFDSIVALLAIQWSGGAYVPLDPAMPAPRLAGMIEDAALTAVLVDQAGAAATAISDVPVLTLAALAAMEGQGPDPAPPSADTLAYIIFTSGSTGRPKGVAVPHRALLASVDARPAVFPEPVRAALLSFPLAFDGSVLAVFSTLARGAALVLTEPAAVPDPASLCRAIARAGATHTVMVPSLHAALLDAALPGQLAGLVACAVAGEACEPALVRRHRAALPRAALVNEYGPTEATIWASAHRCDAADGHDGARGVPIGRAIQGARLYVLDRHLRPALPGVAGEIFIGGLGVAWGYVGNAAATAERFLPDPWSGVPGARMYRTGDRAVARADGALVFLGRCDAQIKLRGHRIEPGEIEGALRAQPGVAEAAVMLRGGDRLVAYVAPPPGQALPDAAALALGAAARLPAYMVPAVVPLAALPRTVSGKLDRNALPDAPTLSADAHDPPPAPGTEAALAAIWREVLGVPVIGATRDFFALGGTSLQGMRLVALIRARLDAPIALHDLFRCPTIRALSLVVERCGEDGRPAAMPILKLAHRRVAAPGPVA